MPRCILFPIYFLALGTLFLFTSCKEEPFPEVEIKEIEFIEQDFAGGVIQDEELQYMDTLVVWPTSTNFRVKPRTQPVPFERLQVRINNSEQTEPITREEGIRLDSNMHTIEFSGYKQYPLKNNLTIYVDQKSTHRVEGIEIKDNYTLNDTIEIVFQDSTYGIVLLVFRKNPSLLFELGPIKTQEKFQFKMPAKSIGKGEHSISVYYGKSFYGKVFTVS